jgi:hypothetical protein
MRLLEFSAATPLLFKDVLGALQQRFGLARVGGEARVYTVGGLLGVVYLVHGGPKAVGLTWARGSKAVTGVYVWNHFNASHSPDFVIDMPAQATTAVIPGIIDFIDHPSAGPIAIHEAATVEPDTNSHLRNFIDQSIANVTEDAQPVPANDEAPVPAPTPNAPITGIQIMARSASGELFVVPGMEATARAIETRLAQQSGSEKTMEQQYEELRSKVELVVTGKAHNLKALGLQEGTDYVVKKGSITDFAAYRALIQNIDGLIIFDDCDSVVATKVGKNMIKGALDTYPVRDLSYDNANTIDTDSMTPEDRMVFVDAMSRVMKGTATADDIKHFDRYANDTKKPKKAAKKKAEIVIDDDGTFELPDLDGTLDLDGSISERMNELQDYFNRRLPNKIDYRGRMIFISNMGEDEWDSAILTRTFRQYMSFGNLEMLDFIERIKDTIQAPGLTTEQKQEVIDWIRHLHDTDSLNSPINFRLIQQGFDLFLTGPGWKSMIADL